MLPPAAAPVSLPCLLHGLAGLLRGPVYLERLRREVREYLGVRYVFPVSSGKAALYLILRALRSRSPKADVVIPAYTCFSVPSAVVKAGLRVVPCDIDETTFDFNYTQLEAAVTSHTLCIIPNHLFGIPADFQRLAELSCRRRVWVVEDAAQALGGRWNGRMLGSVGDVGFFSFGRGKHVTCGSGGLIVTNSETIADAIEREYAGLPAPGWLDGVRDLLVALAIAVFLRPSLYWAPASLPWLGLGETVFHRDFPVMKLSGVKAGLLHRWRERLERSNRARGEAGAQYAARLDGRRNGAASPSYLRYPLLVADPKMRGTMYARGQAQGLGIGLMYPVAVNEIEELRAEFAGQRFPVAERVARHLVTLPTHTLVSRRRREAICELVTGVLRG